MFNIKIYSNVEFRTGFAAMGYVKISNCNGHTAGGAQIVTDEMDWRVPDDLVPGTRL